MTFVDPLVGPSGSGAAWDTRRMFDAVQKQMASATVRQFDSVAARDKAISTPVKGQVCFRGDTSVYEWYDGTAWVTLLMPGAWVAWTPTLTNLTLGNGTVVAAYHQVGKLVNIRFLFTLGTTSAVGTDPTFSLPVTPRSLVTQQNFVAVFTDAGVAEYSGVGVISGSTAKFRAIGAAGTYATFALPTATVPFTFGSTDLLAMYGSYEAA